MTTLADTTHTVDRTDLPDMVAGYLGSSRAEAIEHLLSQPYQVVTQVPPLPSEVAALSTTDGKYLDGNKVAALPLDDLARLYHQARRYDQENRHKFGQEITWLRTAMYEAQHAQNRLGHAENALHNEWLARRTSETITWQALRKVLKDAGMTLDTSRYVYERRHLKGQHFFKAGMDYGSKTEGRVTVENDADLDMAQKALEAAGYTIKHRSDASLMSNAHVLIVVKLREGQTLADLEQPYSPPQTTEPSDA